MTGQQHLTVRAPNWVGDLVMATPVLDAAIESPLWDRVSILVREHLVGVLADGPWADALVPVKGGEERAAYERLAPDAALLLSNSWSAALRPLLARVPIRAGSGLSGRRLLLTHTVVPPTRAGRREPIPTAHLLRDVAGLVGVVPESLHPSLWVRDELASMQAAELEACGLESGADYALCCPGAAFGAAKLWPPQRFARTLDELHGRHGFRGVVTGGPGEEALMDAVASACEHPAISLSAEPRDLERLKALVKGARILVVGDSGPRWYAAAFDVPCVSVMGPNFPELTATSLEHAEVVRLEGLECSPCLQRVCPLGHHRCMERLDVERVIAAAERVLVGSPV